MTFAEMAGNIELPHWSSLAARKIDDDDDDIIISLERATIHEPLRTRMRFWRFDGGPSMLMLLMVHHAKTTSSSPSPSQA